MNGHFIVNFFKSAAATVVFVVFFFFSIVMFLISRPVSAILFLVIGAVFGYVALINGMTVNVDENGDVYKRQNLACDIAIESIIDEFYVKNVYRHQSVYRREVYAKLKEKLRVLTAEGIYKSVSYTHLDVYKRQQFYRETE